MPSDRSLSAQHCPRDTNGSAVPKVADNRPQHAVATYFQVNDRSDRWKTGATASTG
jgi:hypothetical protein